MRMAGLANGRAWLAGVSFLLMAGPAAGQGALVVAGGAVRADNAAVFRAFVDALPDPSGRIAVISAASGSPVGSAAEFVATLGRYAVPEERTAAIRLAVVDDDGTDFDESRWAGNASNPDEIARLDGVAGVWFTGGDQRRIAEVLLEDDGEPTPMLRRLLELHAAGAVIGGTSAGAAVMSDPMITGGEPILALLGVTGRDGSLTTDTGLGFFTPGLVDQHFDARARLGRVVVALALLEQDRRIALGVDEDTAFVYRPDDAELTVVGSGNVTLVDGRDAAWGRKETGIAIEGLTLSVLSPGDRFCLGNERYEPAAYLKPTVGHEYFDHEVIPGGGAAFPATRLARMLGEQLLDNRGARTLERLSIMRGFGTGTDTAAGVMYRFRQTDDSRGYWGRDGNGRSSYSIIRVVLDVVPLTVSLDTAPGLEATDDARPRQDPALHP